MATNACFKDSDLVVVEGTVSEILFKNAENSYMVVALKSDNIPDYAKDRAYPSSLVACGIFIRIVKGQHIKLIGKWEKHPKYKWRFNVSDYEEIMPNDKESLIEYLSCGLFKGVGQKTAQNLVDYFGEDVLNIIRHNPQELTKIRGISSAKAVSISQSYNETEHLEKLMLSLRPFDISPRKVDKIYQRYGDKSLEKIKENPYRLCEDIASIGFTIADRIGREYGISCNNDNRIRAGILYALKEASFEKGHCYLPFDLMVQKTKEVLEKGEISGDVSKNDITRISIDMNNVEDIIIEKDGAAYLPIYYKSEVFAARKLKTLINQPSKKFNFDLDTIIEGLEQKNKIKYANKQKEAFKKLEKTNLLVVTGGPGTGKTTIIKAIVDIYKKNYPGSKIILGAPTGRAAKRMEETSKMPAKTIHRHIEYRPSSDDDEVCGRNEHNPLEADLIIIDESSMIDLLLFVNLLKAVKDNTKLVFVGDIDQLPSVGAGNVLKDMIESKKVDTVFLNEIFRQKNTSKIVINAYKINHGETDLEYDENFVFVEENNPIKIPALVEKFYSDEIKKLKNINHVQLITPFRRKTENGVDNLNKVLQETLNPKRGAEIRYASTNFRANDKVMQYKNNYDKDIYNGDVGRVTRVDPINSEIFVDIDGEEIVYSKDEFEEIQLAYANTIHKSQGCEYPTVIMPVTMQHKRMLQRNLVYTGITRAKVKVILVGEKKALNYAIKNNMVYGRFSKLKERI